MPDHKGLHYTAFKLAASENSVAMPNKPKNNITWNLESGLHILIEFSYYLLTALLPFAVKMINNLL